MTGSTVLVDLSLADLTRAVAAPGPVPGSGSVAAAVGALGAGLASMALAARPGEPEVDGPGAALDRIRAELLARVDQDAAAYRAYLSARGGTGSLVQATELAIAVPRQVAELALGALEVLGAGFERIRPRLHSECATAVGALLSAVEGAAFTAGSNLGALGEARSREETRVALAALERRARELGKALRDRLVDPLEPAR